MLLTAVALGLVGCAEFIDVPSHNHSSRVDYLVIHHTSEDFAESLRLLTPTIKYWKARQVALIP